MRLFSSVVVFSLLATSLNAHGLVIFEDTSITEDVDGDVIVFNGAVVTVDNATIDGSLVIFGGASVALGNSAVNDNVYVGYGSALATTPGGIDGSAIGGSVFAYGAASIFLSDPAGTSIGGSLIVKRSGPQLLISFAEIDGSVLLLKNETVGAAIFQTLIQGDLICIGNSEEPQLINVTVNGYQYCGE